MHIRQHKDWENLENVFLGKGSFYGEFVDKSGKAFYNALNASRGLLVKPLFKIREDMDYGRS